MVFVPSNLSCLPFSKGCAFPLIHLNLLLSYWPPEAAGSEQGMRALCCLLPSRSVIKHQAK